MKILNLYAGIGGNRKLWGDKHEITAIEYDENIAKIYKENFPNDEVIVTDAHKYLLEHFREYDFIWASPPCPTHSKVRKTLAIKKKKDGTIYEQNKPVYPDMRLYEEILLLDGYFDGYYCVENVIPWYEPLIKPQKLGRHCFWANFELPSKKFEARGSFDNTEELAQKLGYDISNWSGVNKKLLLRNCVEPEVGKYILDNLLEPHDDYTSEFTYVEQKQQIQELTNNWNELEEWLLNHYEVKNKIQNECIDEILNRIKEIKGGNKE